MLKFLRNNLLTAILAGFLAGCADPAISVKTDTKAVAAASTQSAVTRKHISNTRAHLQKSADIEVGVTGDLQKAKTDLDSLLNQ
jgi:hypothetical protein